MGTKGVRYETKQDRSSNLMRHPYDISSGVTDQHMEGVTDGPTEGPTDRPSHGDAKSISEGGFKPNVPPQKCNI